MSCCSSHLSSKTWQGDVSLPSLEAETMISGWASNLKSSLHNDLRIKVSLALMRNEWLVLSVVVVLVLVVVMVLMLVMVLVVVTVLVLLMLGGGQVDLHGGPKQLIVDAGLASSPHSWDGARPPRSHSQETDLQGVIIFS